MYNLLVSANDESWNGDPWVTDTSRCVREYTDNYMITKAAPLQITEMIVCRNGEERIPLAEKEMWV